MDWGTASAVGGTFVVVAGAAVGAVRLIARDVVSKVRETTASLSEAVTGLKDAVTGLRSDVKEREETQRKHGEEIAVLKDRLDTRRTRPRRGR